MVAPPPTAAARGRPAGCLTAARVFCSGSNRLIDFMDSLNAMLVVPTMLLVVLKLLFDMLGVAMLAGVLVLVVALVSSGKVMKRLKQLRRDQLKLTDARVKATNEALLAIRVIQSNSWETPMSEQIGKIRDEELRLIRKQAWLQAYVKFLYYSIQVMVALVSFTTFAALGGELRASDIFASIALFALLQRYLNNIPVSDLCHLSNLCYRMASANAKRITVRAFWGPPPRRSSPASGSRIFCRRGSSASRRATGARSSAALAAGGRPSSTASSASPAGLWRCAIWTSALAMASSSPWLAPSAPGKRC